MRSDTPARGRDINGYLPAHLVEGTKWYIEFYSFDPDTDGLRRKRLYVPKITPKTARRTYAQEMILNVNARLISGWNPFLRLSDPKEYTAFDDACDAYRRYLLQLMREDIQRQKTFNGYTSFLNVFRKWNEGRPKPVVYADKDEEMATGEQGHAKRAPDCSGAPGRLRCGRVKQGLKYVALTEKLSESDGVQLLAETVDAVLYFSNGSL